MRFNYSKRLFMVPGSRILAIFLGRSKHIPSKGNSGLRGIVQESSRVRMLFSKWVRLSRDHLLCVGRKDNNKQTNAWGARFLGKGLLGHTDLSEPEHKRRAA